MKWLVQEILNETTNILRVIKALDACSTQYLLLRLNKDNTLTVIDIESKIPLDNSDKILKEFINNEKVMVYGSKEFAKIADNMKLNPGSFANENFEFEVLHKELGVELLNNNFIIGELSSLQPTAENFFIRPTGNTKLFTGMVVSKKDFLEWQKRETREGSPYTGQTLMISPLSTIRAEYRFFVVGQKIVTASSYKIGERQDISIKPSNEIIKYADKIVEKFPLSEAYVLDIAETDEGLRVIEYNNINTSGLYGCDEVAFVKAINALG